MSTSNPGRLPASVYRRRRIVVGLALLAVIAIVVLLLIPRGGDTPETPTPTGTSSSTPVSAEAACDPAVIVLTPVTDSASYPDGQNPLISMTILNNGAIACTLNVGTDAQRYEIVSGSDPIWNSTDCQEGAVSYEQVLAPGEELSTTPFSWDRTRSSTSTCDSERPAVAAGGATYRLSVTLGDIVSEGDTPFLLN